ncbi:unnamed protein product [Adineta steineri]|uniref:Uncharacterized protein n=1 Tax=Adineta steineri TaxID=433720 RepID=A0A814T0A0_9BILA|nr:unnamed protein product [Adineta steineri]
MSSKAADILLETGSSFKRIAELTMELVDPNSSNRLSNSSSTSSSQKLAIDSSELKRLRDALQRFSSDLDAVSQRIHTNLDPNSSNRLSNSSSTSSSQKLAIDSSELKRLRDALQRFSSDLDAVSQRIHTNREAAAAPQEVERLMSLNLVETKDEPEIKSEEILTTNDNQSAVPMTV